MKEGSRDPNGLIYCLRKFIGLKEVLDISYHFIKTKVDSFYKAQK